MARRLTLVDLTARRDRLERRIIRLARTENIGLSMSRIFYTCIDLRCLDGMIADEERKIRRAVRKLAK